MSQSTIPRLDTPAKLTGKARTLDLIVKQQRWIEYCEANGRSYAGRNGHAIRQADLNQLRALEARL